MDIEERGIMMIWSLIVTNSRIYIQRSMLHMKSIKVPLIEASANTWAQLKNLQPLKIDTFAGAPKEYDVLC